MDDEEGEQAVEHAATAVNTDRAPPRSARPGPAVEKFGGRFVIGPAFSPLSSTTLLCFAACPFTWSRKMGRLKQKGKAGAAKAYVTRSAAVKKLQCSLADFRRLCILKGASNLLNFRMTDHLGSRIREESKRMPLLCCC